MSRTPERLKALLSRTLRSSRTFNQTQMADIFKDKTILANLLQYTSTVV
jgi:hypothetical protein